MKYKWKIAGVAGICAGLSTFVITKFKQKDAMEKKQHIPYGPYEALFKRPFDVVLSGLALVVLSPVMVMIAVIVRVGLGKPVLFKQERPGLDENIFTIKKFRTMGEQKDGNGELLPDLERLTKLGEVLRSASLDELPELFNILKGEMSIVGPRPLVPKYLPYFTEEERHRHDVRPGLTGMAQAEGRNLLSWDYRLKLDVKYVNKITFLGDVKIIWKTLLKVIRKEGIVVRGTKESVLDFDVERRGFKRAEIP